jgi:hypothetical protein
MGHTAARAGRRRGRVRAHLERCAPPGLCASGARCELPRTQARTTATRVWATSTRSTSRSRTCTTAGRSRACRGAWRGARGGVCGARSWGGVGRHDVSMQMIGQPARDIARHFVQRSVPPAHLPAESDRASQLELAPAHQGRARAHLAPAAADARSPQNHTRTMPFLLPPPEFQPGELTKMGLTGTCELQICRSTGPWSMGTPQKTEHSIQTAYLKCARAAQANARGLLTPGRSDPDVGPLRLHREPVLHHVVRARAPQSGTADRPARRTMVGDVKVENQIGDAIVERAIRAHREGTPWRCCIVIPLLPGFTFPVDHSDASAVGSRACPCRLFSTSSLDPDHSRVPEQVAVPRAALDLQPSPEGGS